jgi:predicted methyltransferase
VGPLLTRKIVEHLRAAARAGASTAECSLDLGRSTVTVELNAADWIWRGDRFPYPEGCKDRTIYHWTEQAFRPAARYTNALTKLVPTDWGPPTFEIDGIKMLPTSRMSPAVDAEQKVGCIQPRGKQVLDTCGGLGYFADCCLRGGARRVMSFEKNADVIWLRSLNPWSPPVDDRLTLTRADITLEIERLPSRSFDAILHDPPRFGTAGELYSGRFYEQLARVLRVNGRLFHYTGTPNRLTSGRDVPREVAKRLRGAGFSAELHGDGILAIRAS